ncbi:phosphotransferase family protein [Sphingobium sp. YR768]|uniref:phosphotransferase family protein n=1 Tax=Sphingobium sp. YR768 TaxID=1884365 RepID=UPI0008C74E3D|nr:phosphotransferase family protein [Sphingobium sp. YR768]SER69862.1 Predicted kinase, aminoglycoside phosphotransferase (APT) family [Sphingobium sp. YR768]
MSISARLLRSLNRTVAIVHEDVVYASNEEALVASLKILETRESFHDPLFSGWRDRLEAQLAGLVDRLSLSRIAPDLFEAVEAIRAALAAAPDGKAEREAMQRATMRDWSLLVERLASDPRIDAAERTRIVFETSDAELTRIGELCGDLLPVETMQDTAITALRLQAYLADRFDDAGLRVTDFRPLPGGYGKETILFMVEGQALSGAFVMRRDRDEPTMDNDCHRVRYEFPVIRAAYDHGFPAPEALWVDEEHQLLPGGDFLIMTRAPGTSGGNVHGAAGKVDQALVDLLAGSVARLHQLPPMRELGDLTDGIASHLWDLPLAEVTRRYIQSIKDLYLREMAMPSPAVLALYGWLMDNIPEATGRPVLLHGDIGFHNFIVDDGRLSAVVDWEFSHIGDPADDVGYVRNTVGNSLDWGAFMDAYRAAGGPDLDEARVRFFQIWGHVRNLTASQLTTNCFETGKLDELKLGHVGHSMMAGFLRPIRDMMAS